MQVRNIERLVDMQFPLSSVLINSVIVKHTVREVRALLNFHDKAAAADCVHSPRRNEKDIVFMYRDFLQELQNRPVSKSLPQLLFRNVAVETVNQASVFGGVGDVPEFCFA